MSRRALALLGVATAATAWIVALAAESSVRMVAGATASLGADLPSLTLMAIAAVKNHLAWILALAATVALALLWVRRSPRFLLANAVVGVTLAVLGAAVVMALGLPFSLCGEKWPAWPEARTHSPSTATPTAAAQATAPRSRPARSCG